MKLSRQECWSKLPWPPPGDLPNPGIKPRSPVLQADSLISEPPGDPHLDCIQCQYAGCDILLQFYKVLLLKLGKGYMMSLCYSYFFNLFYSIVFLFTLFHCYYYICVNLQLSKNSFCSLTAILLFKLNISLQTKSCPNCISSCGT